MAKVAGSGMMIVGGGTGDLVFSYSNPVLTVGTAGYPVTTMQFLSSSAIIKMGASPASLGAINIDGASYSTVAANFNNTTMTARLIATPSNIQFGTISNHLVRFYANNIDQWGFDGSTAATSTISALQVTARIVGGSTNGLAIRNSANSRDNLSIADNGGTVTSSDGTHSLAFGTVAASGEQTAGAAYYVTSNSNLWLRTLSTATARTVGALYYNGTQLYSAWEISGVASGFGTLALMKSGGAVTIGTAPTGSVAQVLQAGGSIIASGTVSVSGAAATTRDISIMTAGVSRWLFRATNGAESGSNAGSDLQIMARADDGSAIDAPVSIVRAAAGAITFARSVAFGAAAVAPAAGQLAIGGTQQTTIGANGAASALTANPLGYIKGFIGSTAIVIPYYNA